MSAKSEREMPEASWHPSLIPVRNRDPITSIEGMQRKPSRPAFITKATALQPRSHEITSHDYAPA
jgi:hypothetical protein